MQKRVIKIIIRTIACIGFVFSAYLSIGYYVKGSQQPILIQNGVEHHFWGFYIMAIVYASVAVLCILVFVLTFILKRRKKEREGI